MAMENIMVIPTLQQAEAYLAEAVLMNPGKWVNHSRNAAQAASIFASRY